VVNIPSKGKSTVTCQNDSGRGTPISKDLHSGIHHHRGVEQVKVSEHRCAIQGGWGPLSTLTRGVGGILVKDTSLRWDNQGTYIVYGEANTIPTRKNVTQVADSYGIRLIQTLANTFVWVVGGGGKIPGVARKNSSWLTRGSNGRANGAEILPSGGGTQF